MRLPNGYGTVYKLSGNRRNLMLLKKQKDGKATRKQVKQNNYTQLSDIIRPVKKH